jgi:2-polyprenyl-3-methyl-5-hydroxy-6-metoxy-1,4-benzoquinol methylase
VKEFGCQGHGMDALPDFIQEAKTYAEKNNVAQKCTFETGDIRRKIDQFRGYDLVILGSIGPVFGDIKTTLLKVQTCIKKKGYIILDDGYISKKSKLTSMVYVKEAEIFQNIEAAKMEIVDMTQINTDTIRKSNKNIYDRIHKRAIELMKKHPEHQYLFEGYVKSQEEENTILENEITSVTWLLRKQRG